MIFKKNIQTIIFGYGAGLFPLFLLTGPLIPEIFLIISIFFSWMIILKQKQYKYVNTYFIFFCLFFLSTIFSTLLNYYSFSSAKGGISYFRIPLFAFAIWFIFDNFKIFNKKIVFLYSSFLILIISDSILQYFTGENITGNEILKYRISSFFGNELVLGGFLIRLIPVYLVFLIMSDSISEGKINILHTFLISLACLIIYLSGERTSFFLLLLFFCIIFFCIKYLRKLIFIIIIISIILSFSVSFLKNSQELDPAERMFSHTYEQFVGRGKGHYQEHKKKLFGKVYVFSHDHHGHYLLSLKIIRDYPIFGTGARGFRYLCRNKIYILENNDGCSTHPHNTYLQIFTSNGIVGFSLLLFAFFYIVLEILKSRKKINLGNNFNKYETSKTILLAIILVNLWPFAPSGNFFNNWLSMLYFYPVGLYLYFKFKNEKKAS